MTEERLPVAAVITEWRKNSHADVFLGRLIEPEAWGHSRPLGLRLVAVYADQFPSNDLCRSKCEAHQIPVCPTVLEAVAGGKSPQSVAGVLIIGEHGDYPTNRRRQKLYPRRRLFEEVVHAFRVLGRRVPVFSDKHLSYDFLSARWMVDLARHEGFPLMAGSSLPVAWRVPPREPPSNRPIHSALALGYGDLDAYGFHALEMLQCMLEQRQGGESGVRSVRCRDGLEVWKALNQDQNGRVLLEATLSARQLTYPGVRPPVPGPRDALFELNYADGVNASVAMLGSIGECFAYGERRSSDLPAEATVFALEDGHPYGHFGHLLQAIVAMVRTGNATYPVERTLLTGGILEAMLQSRLEGGTLVWTPHLAKIRYQPRVWPFAKGKPGTPA
jgi:hypothetical protein